MELTETQKLLIRCLLLFGVGKDAIVGIISALETPEQVDGMMEWLDEHRTATISDILKKTVELTSNGIL